MIPSPARLVENGPKPIAAYIHVPFCSQRCGYCNFSLLANRPDLYERYVDAMERELSRLEVPRPVKTIFYGGGTPSILPEQIAERLFELIRYWLPLDDGGECSLEANPRDISEKMLGFWKSQGINRLSIGGQSFQETKLKVLERDHNPNELIDSVERAIAHIPRVSLDLIFAAPGETLKDWLSDLDHVLKLGLEHVSTYGLTFEKGSSFWGRLQRKELKRADEDLELEMYTQAIDVLTQGGLEHYEVSNFARPGQACQHNQTYWNGDRWWAFGPSAASYLGKHRSVNHHGTLNYLRRLEAGETALIECEELSIDQQWRERFVFGMRQMRGVPWSQWRSSVPEKTRSDIDKALQEHIDMGYLEVHGEYVRLSRAGLVVSDGLWSSYFDAS